MDVEKKARQEVFQGVPRTLLFIHPECGFKWLRQAAGGGSIRVVERMKAAWEAGIKPMAPRLLASKVAEDVPPDADCRLLRPLRYDKVIASRACGVAFKGRHGRSCRSWIATSLSHTAMTERSKQGMPDAAPILLAPTISASIAQETPRPQE